MVQLRTQCALFRVIEQTAGVILATDQEHWTLGQISSRLDLLETYWHQFLDNHVQLLEDGEATESEYFNDNIYTQCEKFYSDARGRLYDEQDRLRGPPPTQSLDSSFLSQQSNRMSSAKLTPIELPEFSGSQSDWESFRDLFVSLVHENPALNAVHKMMYLKTHVQGEAKRALEKLQVTNQNYETSWTILQARYDQKRTLIQDHLRSLVHIHPLKEESADGIQLLADDISRHRNQLKTLGCPVDQWDAWFITLASEAMDPITRRNWEREIDDDRGERNVNSDFPEFSVLERFLQRQSRTLRAVGNVAVELAAESSVTEPAGNRPIRRPVHALSTTSNQVLNCGMCGSNHYIGRCDKFQALDSSGRRNVVIEKSLCFNCLRGGHISRDCPSQVLCKDCSGQHHTLIHDGSGKRRKPDSRGYSNKKAKLQTFATTSEISEGTRDAQNLESSS